MLHVWEKGEMMDVGRVPLRCSACVALHAIW